MAVRTDRDVYGDPSGSPPARPEPSRLSYLISLAVAVVLFVAIVWGSSFYFDHFDHRGPRGGSQTLGAAPATSTTQVQATTSTAGATTTTTAGATTTTTVNPAGIPAAPANPPSLAGAYSTDPTVVLRTVSMYSDWLFAHPDPTLLSNYMQPTCPYFDSTKSELTTLASKGWHQRPTLSEIQWAKTDVPFAPEGGIVNGHKAYLGGSAKAVIVEPPGSADILDSTGQVVTNFTNQMLLQMVVITFSQGSDGRFRVQDEAEFSPPGGVAAFES